MISRNPLRRAAGLGAAALVLAAGLAPAAHAGTYRHADATGDVRVTSENVGGGPITGGTQPDFRRGDITSLTVQHTRDGVKVATGLRALPTTWQARIVTSRGTNVYDLRRIENGGGPMVSLSRNGKPISCDGVRAVPTASGIYGFVPRSCLGTPYRVRAGVNAYSNVEDGDDDVFTQGRDDALQTARVTTFRPTLGSWVTSR